MPVNIKGYRVFISWQEGLENERDVFYKTIDYFNKKRARRRGFLFIPIDFKKITGGYGRPQTKINLTLDDCDYLIVTLWDRWGEPPDKNGTGEYSSGTEEEYNKAVECLKDKRPMCDVVVFFKAIPAEKLINPSEQVTNVLKFREKVKKEGLFKDFKSIDQFKELITDHLEEWLFRLEYPNQPTPLKVTVFDKVTVGDKGNGIVTKTVKGQE